MTKRLCELPAAAVETCCAAPVAPRAVPFEIANPPGLDSIDYRIGTFSSFRRTMLDRLADSDLPGLLENPFDEWQEGSPNDYQTMFVELWAYLADVLTFYQERIANESFIPTAKQLSSLIRLAETINYRPRPGAAAGALVAFTVEKGKTVTVPASFRVSTRAAGGKPAAVFETSEAIQAIGSLSKIAVATTAPHYQFGPTAATVELTRKIEAIFGSTLASQFLGILRTRRNAVAAPVSPPATPPATVKRTVVFAGTQNRIAAGDWLLAVANEGAATGEIREICRVVSATPDDDSKTTSVEWEENAARADGYGSGSPAVKVYAFRVVATPFGSSAPMAETGKSAKPWDALDSNKNPVNPGLFYIPPTDERPFRLSLDSVYDQIDATPSSPGWMLLHKDGAPRPQELRVVDAKTAGRAQYEISAKVTRLEVASTIPFPENIFPLRATTVYAASEVLPLQIRLPLSEAAGGPRIALEGAVPELVKGQTILFEGVPDEQNATARAAEAVTIADTPVVDREGGITFIQVTPALKQYLAAGAVVYANVAPATHGETVRNEILGSGDGSAFQTFELDKSPLTYLPAKSAEGLSAVESTLAVTVNHVQWHEVATLLTSEPDARRYETRADDEAVLSVTFGDGVNGARLPTGKDNVVARYRKGLGRSGNVAEGAIQVLVDNVAGVQKVTNPIATAGGDDAETTAQIRTNAPESVRTFSRAISVDDYAALALTYPAVAKASASWITFDAVNGLALARPYIRLTIATTDGAPLSTQRVFAAGLRAYLDRRRDPNVALQITDFTPVQVELTAAVEVLDDFPREGTRSAVEAAARARLAFERLGFGESLRLSSVYSALQGVAGVRSVTITDFRRTTDASGRTPDDVLIAATELAVLHGLSISASGGFSES